MHEEAEGHQVYRLKHWPSLPERFRTAKVLRACSRMSVGPVTANWFHAHVGLKPEQATSLLDALLAQDAIECIDLGRRVAVDPAPAQPAEVAPAPRLPMRFAWKHAALAAIMGTLALATAALEQHFAPGLGLLAFSLPAFG